MKEVSYNDSYEMEGLVDEWFRVKCILVRYRRFEVTYDMDNRTVFVKYANCRKFFRAGGDICSK